MENNKENTTEENEGNFILLLRLAGAGFMIYMAIKLLF